jgi:hypothetical protein
MGPYGHLLNFESHPTCRHGFVRREWFVYAMQLGEVSTHLVGATRQANEIYGTCAPSELSKCEESTLPLLSKNLPSRVISRVI